MAQRQPYSGTSRKLILALDVGTTFSGISYSILDPGQVPEIKGVMKFPDQELISADSKVPTIIWYGKDGSVKAIGAGAVYDGIEEQAEEEGWLKVEWFKMHMRPKSLIQDDVTNFIDKFPPLPDGKDVTMVFGDFLEYLHSCAQIYIKEHHTNGKVLWESLIGTAEIILSHPNGWEGAQQAIMRSAAIAAGLVPNELGGASRIHFVTEGEASLLYCVAQGLTTESMKNGSDVMVIDAGGGTIDISTYGQPGGAEAGFFEEVSIPECQLQGSVFVSQRARIFLEGVLQESKFACDIQTMVENFDKTGKLRFRNDEDAMSIKFGSKKDTEAEYNIRFGQIKILGQEVATFFQPSIDRIVKTIIDNCKGTNLHTVFMVGGFSASDWLFNKVKEAVEDHEIDVCRPDSHVNKAVPEGAISFYIDKLVSGRRSRFDYGICAQVHYNPTAPDHVARGESVFVDVDGSPTLNGAFDVILRKGTVVHQETAFPQRYSCISRNADDFAYTTTTIHSYRGGQPTPAWIDQKPDSFQNLCTIDCCVPANSSAVKSRLAPDGTKYYEWTSVVKVFFGLTELKAQISWMEDGKVQFGPATIVYDTNF